VSTNRNSDILAASCGSEQRKTKYRSESLASQEESDILVMEELVVFNVGYLTFAIIPILSMCGSRCRSVSADDRCAGGRDVSTCSRRRQRRVVNSIAALLRPLGLSNPLRILPWAGIAQRTATGTVARTAEDLGQILGWHLCQQLRLVSRAENVDLGARDRVEELLDDAEDARETPGCVDDVHLSEALGVVVLRDGGDGLQVAIDGGGLGDTDALQVEDGARGLEEVAGLARAGGQTGVGHLFVFADEVLHHALLAGDLAEGSEVDVAELLDVDWAAILQTS
jgi:hypothetical protein